MISHFAALVSFCYNIEEEAFCNSTFLQNLKKNYYKAVSIESQE
ncbi:glycoside hydrolase family protein [Bartonella bacilliformis]